MENISIPYNGSEVPKIAVCGILSMSKRLNPSG